MPRQPANRWSADQSREIARQVKRFNDKLYREAKKNPELQAVGPERLSVRSFKAEHPTGSMRDLRTLQRQVERLFRPKALEVVVNPQGVATTRYELREIGIKTGVINRERAKVRKQLPPPSPYRGTMGKAEEHELQPKKVDFQKVKREKDWQKIKESVTVQSKRGARKTSDNLYKQMYLANIQSSGPAGQALYQFVQNLPASKVVAGAYYDSQLQLRSLPGSDDTSDPEGVCSSILGVWKEFTGQPDTVVPDTSIADELESLYNEE